MYRIYKVAIFEKVAVSVEEPGYNWIGLEIEHSSCGRFSLLKMTNKHWKRGTKWFPQFVWMDQMAPKRKNVLAPFLTLCEAANSGNHVHIHKWRARQIDKAIRLLRTTAERAL